MTWGFIDSRGPRESGFATETTIPVVHDTCGRREVFVGEDGGGGMATGGIEARVRGVVMVGVQVASGNQSADVEVGWRSTDY